MQNSLEQLLDGVVRALLDEIAPALDDPYARSQALAAADIVANVATRVRWDPTYLTGWTAEARSLMADAVAWDGRAPDGELASVRAVLAGTATGDGGDEMRSIDALEAFAELQRWVADDPRREGTFGARLRSLADAMLDDELSRLRRT